MNGVLRASGPKPWGKMTKEERAEAIRKAKENAAK
jgi:hypothetical protein